MIINSKLFIHFYQLSLNIQLKQFTSLLIISDFTVDNTSSWDLEKYLTRNQVQIGIGFSYELKVVAHRMKS